MNIPVKILEEIEADEYFNNRYWEIVTRSYYFPESFIKTDIVDGIKTYAKTKS